MKLFLLILFAVVSAAAQEASVIVKRRQANIREAPSTSAKVVATVNINTKLTVSWYSGDWYLVKKGATKGWIHYSVIRMEDEKASEDFLDAFIKKQLAEEKDRWVIYGSSGDEIFLYNRARMTRRGSIVSAWTRSTDKSKENAALTGMSLSEVDCSTQRIRSPAGTKYSNGKVSRSWDEPDANWRVITPESIGEALSKVACNLD